MAHVDKMAPMVPTGSIGFQSQQAFAANVAQMTPGNHLALPVHSQIPNPPTKRVRTGTTRMRPSKTSITPR